METLDAGSHADVRITVFPERVGRMRMEASLTTTVVDTNPFNNLVAREIEVGAAVTIEPDAGIPLAHALHGSYPNPFNPETVISFDLPQTEHVLLLVMDILGRRVATLVNEERPAGRYQVQWRADDAASGVYFIRLETSTFTQTRKAVLVK